MIFRRINSTEPVKSFVFDQLKKNNMLMMLGELNINQLTHELKQTFEPKMDKWLFKRANWMTVAMAIKEKYHELKKLEE